MIEQQQALRDRLDEVEEKLAAFVGFDQEQKSLAGCFISIGQDGTPFLDKGLVKPEHKKQLASLLKAESGDEAVPVARNGGMSESLRRDLAGYRLQIAQVEMAKHPALAFDYCVFHVASGILGDASPLDGPNVQFKRHPSNRTSPKEETLAGSAFDEIKASLPVSWLKPASEAARFEAFCALPDASKQELFAFCVALTLQPTLGSDEGDGITAFDAVLSRTGADVAGYWRPGKDNYLGRLRREQLLAIGREMLGDSWAQLRAGDKKTFLAEQLDRAFADPAQAGRTPEQVEKLTRWLPEGMEFSSGVTRPAKAKKTRKAA